MARVHFVKRRWSVAVVLAVALSGCDKIPGFGGDEQAQADNQAQPTEPSTPAADPVVEPTPSRRADQSSNR